jgi:ABC-type sugar transport system ATPase subunit
MTLEHGAGAALPNTAGHPAEGDVIVEARGVSKHYGGITALDGVDLKLKAGQVLAIVGDNGAGKSTLLKILSGNIQPSEGDLMIDGVVRRFHGPLDATEAGVATVYQDLALALDLNVIDNLFLGRELTVKRPFARWLNWLDTKAMAAQTLTALEGVHIRIPDVREECSRLSGGQRQAIAIARAVAWSSRVLLLDEPTAALGVEQQREVLNLIQRVRDTGVSVVLVSHQLVHVMEVADVIGVLRRGRLVSVLDREAATVERLLGLITGLEGETHDLMGTQVPAGTITTTGKVS